MSPRILREISSIIYFYKDQFFNTPLRLRKLIYIYKFILVIDNDVIYKYQIWLSAW